MTIGAHHPSYTTAIGTVGSYPAGVILGWSVPIDPSLPKSM